MSNPVALHCVEALVVQNAVQKFVTGSISLFDGLDVSMTGLQYSLEQYETSHSLI